MPGILPPKSRDWLKQENRGCTNAPISLALQACRLINKYLPLAVRDGGNLEARTEMLVASNLAVISLVLGGGAVPIHNFAHAIGATLRIPHGQGNAVFMPAVMKNLKNPRDSKQDSPCLSFRPISFLVLKPLW